MEFELVSDLHIESWKNSPPHWPETGGSDTLLIVGDTSNSTAVTAETIRGIAQHYKRVLVTTGNHEASATSPGMAPRELTNCLKRLGVYNVWNLEDGPIKIRDTAFCGACGWWDYSTDGSEEYTANRIKSWSGLDGAGRKRWAAATRTLGLKDLVRMTQWTHKLEADPSIARIVCATHTPPRRELITDEYPPGPLAAKGAYCHSRMADSALTPKVKMWVFGHNHEEQDTVLESSAGDKCRYISHPRGQPWDFSRWIYSPLRVKVPP
ncbi:MAG: hypothetical protein CMA10_04770 [Euryarchaeota archaeon]|nr:hypothetical protein [Euryarchaeota archaeon]